MIEIVIPSTHPALRDHFPGHPIVPAAIVLETLLSALAVAYPEIRAHQGVDEVKFRHPLHGDERGRLTATTTPRGLRFRLECEGREIVSGLFKVTPTGAHA
jgi:3-hydroxymyristoyl/3-hydroxydecanoyl-(acyl carrier protein) dehydratase